MIIAVTRPRARRPIVVNIVQVLPVQALGARLLERRVALPLPLHRAQLARLPIVGQVPGRRAVRVVPIRVTGRVIVAVRVTVVGPVVLTPRRVIVIVIVMMVVVVGMVAGPQRGGGDGHVDCLPVLPVRVPVPVPTHRDTVVVEGALGQRVHVLIGQVAGHVPGRVRVQALLMVHDPVHGILSPRRRLPRRRLPPPARPPRPVPRDHRPPLHPPGRHRFRRHPVVVDRRLRLRVLDAVQRPRLLLLP